MGREEKRDNNKLYRRVTERSKERRGKEAEEKTFSSFLPSLSLSLHSLLRSSSLLHLLLHLLEDRRDDLCACDGADEAAEEGRRKGSPVRGGSEGNAGLERRRGEIREGSALVSRREGGERRGGGGREEPEGGDVGVGGEGGGEEGRRASDDVDDASGDVRGEEERDEGERRKRRGEGRDDDDGEREREGEGEEGAEGEERVLIGADDGKNTAGFERDRDVDVLLRRREEMTRRRRERGRGSEEGGDRLGDFKSSIRGRATRGLHQFLLQLLLYSLHSFSQEEKNLLFCEGRGAAPPRACLLCSINGRRSV